MKPTFPIGPRASVSAGLLHVLTQQYGFDRITTHRDLGGAYNLNLYLDSSRGPFVARVYRPWVTSQRLLALHRLKQWLNARNLPVILPIPTCSEDTLTVYDARVIEVEPYVPHREIGNEPSYHARGFALLGRFHSLLAEYPATAPIPQPLVENYGLPANQLHWVEHTRQRIQQIASVQASEALAICDVTRDLLTYLSTWWTHEGCDLPQQLTHGDYGIGNLLWDEHYPVAVGDFDFLASPRHMMPDTCLHEVWHMLH